jgi:hypothetical protein
VPPFDKDGRRRHEPEARDIIVDALGVLGIVGIGRGDAGEEILVGFAGQKVAVLQRLLAEVRQKRIARRIGLHRKAPQRDGLAVALRVGARFALGDALAQCKIHSFLPGFIHNI